MPISSFRSSNFYRKKLSVDIDSAIAGLTANDSTKLIFSTMTPNGTCCNGDSSTDPVNPVFIRSTTCWAKNIDTSPISPWNNGGGYTPPQNAGGFGGTGTLISPRHVLLANHFYIKSGKKLIFVDMNNNCYIRTLTNSLQVGATDIRIGVLDSDLPSNISFCKVASFDLTTITNTNNRVATLYLNQQRKALVGDYFNFDSSGSLDISTNSQRSNFYELPIDGDSGNPINFVYNNKIILLFLFNNAFGGPSIPDNIAAINSVMTTLGGGYTLSLFNKNDVISQEKNISIKKENLTSLFNYNTNPRNNFYIFKSGTVNTISTVFNIGDFVGGTSTSTADLLYINNVIYYRKTGIGAGWRTAAGADATNVVINPDSTIFIVYVDSVDNTSRSVNSGAIIQRYNLGKLTAQSTILQLWLKSDAGVILDGQNVIEWKDQSGHSKNFTKSIASTGFPKFSDGAVLFTANSIYSDRNASILALPSSSLNFTTPYTLFTVIRAGANNSAVFSKSYNFNKRRKYQILMNGGIIYSLESKNNFDTYIEYDTGTGDNVNVKRLIVSQYSSNTFGLLRYNGEQVATGENDVGIDQTNDASVFIGAAAFSEGTGYNAEASTEMYVYEILFYNQALSTFEIQKIEAYLNNKYSIY